MSGPQTNGIPLTTWHSDYQDQGCSLSPSCLKCPFVQCRYDDPGWVRREQRDKRDRDIAKGYAEGRTRAELGLQYGTSQRVIYRAIKHWGD